jgi:hypothetical protein
MVARHGAIPGIAVADKTLVGVTYIRPDASVVGAAKSTSQHVILDASFPSRRHSCCPSDLIARIT